MFTAAMVLCSMVNVTQCQGMGSVAIYTTEKECMAQHPMAYDHFKQRNMLVMAYRCINWGEVA